VRKLLTPTASHALPRIDATQSRIEIGCYIFKHRPSNQLVLPLSRILTIIPQVLQLPRLGLPDNTEWTPDQQLFPVSIRLSQGMASLSHLRSLIHSRKQVFMNIKHAESKGPSRALLRSPNAQMCLCVRPTMKQCSVPASSRAAGAHIPRWGPRIHCDLC
jgi:hypothetical protein